MERISLHISGIDCPTCVAKIEKALRRQRGVEAVSLSLSTGRAEISFDPAHVSVARINAVITGLGHAVEGRPPSSFRRYWRMAACAMLILLSFAGLSSHFTGFDIFAVAAIIIGGQPLVWQAWRDIQGRNITSDVFMALGVIASAGIGEFRSAAIIAFFMLISAFVEAFTMGRSRRAIRELIEQAPTTARVRRGDGEIEVPADEVMPGEIVLVKPGEKIPVEGVIISGRGAINEAPITGESMPAEKGPGDRVFAATVNQLGVLVIKVEQVGDDTTYGRIIRLVEEAEAAKAPVQRYADRFAAWFTPVILVVSIATYLLTGELRNAIAVVVVACPCSIAVATPLAVLAGMGRAARCGIMVKGGRYLEALAAIDTLVMDKTGTVTLGDPVVTDVIALGSAEGPGAGRTEAEVLRLAATMEKYSEHPLARAVLKAASSSDIAIAEPSSSLVLPGLGVEAVLADNTPALLGNRALLEQRMIVVSSDAEQRATGLEHEGKTVLLVVHEKTLVGLIAVADVIRNETIAALAELRGMGFAEPVMLTGDNPRTAEAIAARLGIRKVFAGLLPHDKVDCVSELAEQGRQILMVGDGINDAPALARAHVGIAMAAAGSAAAIEAADVALMRDDWRQVPAAIGIGRSTARIIRQNIAIGLAFNIVGIGLASVGILTPTGAAVAHVLPDVLVFLNAARLLRDNQKS